MVDGAGDFGEDQVKENRTLFGSATNYSGTLKHFFFLIHLIKLNNYLETHSPDFIIPEETYHGNFLNYPENPLPEYS